MEPLFRRMIAVSATLHVAAFLLFSVWAALHAPPARSLSVAVVDLVGGEAFAPRTGGREGPADGEAAPPGEGRPFGGPPERGARRAPDRLVRRPPRPPERFPGPPRRAGRCCRGCPGGAPAPFLFSAGPRDKP